MILEAQDWSMRISRDCSMSDLGVAAPILASKAEISGTDWNLSSAVRSAWMQRVCSDVGSNGLGPVAAGFAGEAGFGASLSMLTCPLW